MRARRMMIGAMFVLAPGTFFAQSPVPKTSRIVGIVIDSIRKSGLEGAEVIVSGLARPVTSDSLGRFTVDSLAPGTYQVGGRGGSCTRVWVDGFEWRMVDAGDIDTFVQPSDIIGLEVYKAHEAPVQYRGVDDNCITLLLGAR